MTVYFISNFFLWSKKLWVFFLPDISFSTKLVWHNKWRSLYRPQKKEKKKKKFHMLRQEQKEL